MNRLQLTHRFENSIGMLAAVVSNKFPDVDTGYWRINPAYSTTPYYGKTACKVVSDCWEIETGSLENGFEIPQEDNFYIKMQSPLRAADLKLNYIAFNLLGKPDEDAVIYGKFTYDGKHGHVHWDGNAGTFDTALDLLDAYSPTAKDYNEEFMSRFVDDFSGIYKGMQKAIKQLS